MANPSPAMADDRDVRLPPAAAGSALAGENAAIPAGGREASIAAGKLFKSTDALGRMSPYGPHSFASYRMPLNVEDMWIDVGFRITPEGKVSDLQTLRSH